MPKQNVLKESTLISLNPILSWAVWPPRHCKEGKAIWNIIIWNKSQKEIRQRVDLPRRDIVSYFFIENKAILEQYLTPVYLRTF